MVRIVVLDGWTLNPGDLSWDELAAIGPCTVHERTPADLTVQRSREAEVILTNKVVVDRQVMAECRDLRYVGVLATGYNVVDVRAAAERGVVVSNVPTYGTSSVAQMTFALLLELTQHVGHHAGTVRDGRWTASTDFCYWDFPLVELDGLTMGIIGFGRIGRAVGRIAQAFGMQVVAHDPQLGEPAPGVPLVELDALLQQSDVVSLHCPLTESNRGFVNAERLARMKRGALLINTSRGPLVNEQELADALADGRIGGAALDVLAVEPPLADNPLLRAPNCIVTPHVAWATRAARARLMKSVVQNVRAFLSGDPQNVVSGRGRRA